MKKVNLTDCEQQVIMCIWDTENDMSLLQIVDMVNARFGKNWKPQTVSTFLSRLVKKDCLSMYRVGRQFFYHPAVEKKEFGVDAVTDCVRSWCGNDASVFLTMLKEGRGISPEEAAALKEFVGKL